MQFKSALIFILINTAIITGLPIKPHASIDCNINGKRDKNGIACKNISTPMNTTAKYHNYTMNIMNDSLKNNTIKRITRRSRRQIINVDGLTDQISRFLVDALTNTLTTSLGTPAGIVDAVKPYLLSASSELIQEAAKLMKNVIRQRPFLDGKWFKDKTYEAYPVFIPGYGSFILLSETGVIETFKEKLESDYKSHISAPNENSHSDETIDSNTSSAVREDFEDYETFTENFNTTIEQLKSEGRDIEERPENVPKRDEFYLGEAHLIPIISKPDIFERSRNVEDFNKNSGESTLIKTYIKQIINTQSTIKSFKKRMILGILKLLEQSIRSL